MASPGLQLDSRRYDGHPFIRTARVWLGVLTLASLGCDLQVGDVAATGRPSFTPSGETFLVSVHPTAPRVYEYRLDGQRVGSMIARATEAVASRDGRSFVFVRPGSGNDAHLWIKNGSNEIQITTGDVYDYSPVFIAGDAEVMFLRSSTLRSTSTFGTKRTDWDVYRVSVRGGIPRRLTRKAFREVSGLSVSADSRTAILGMRELQASSSIWRLDVDDGEVTPLNADGASPAIFPDGSTIAFVQQAGEDERGFYNYAIFTRPLDGPATKRVDLQSYLWSPSVAPDGSSILFLSDPERDGTFELWQVRTSDWKPTRIPLGR